MNNWILLGLAASLLSYQSTAQNLPECIQKLSKKTKASTTKFEKKLILKQDQTVYQFLVKSARQCMDCDNALIFYDADCNVLAYFMRGRGTNAFVAEGYTAADFGKEGYPNIRHGIKKPAASK